jgi:uroporphyrinogen decarboxylase
MRQAGRWDPEFNRLRGDLSFYEFSENVRLATQASLLPRRFGVDGIILFYDITTLAVAMGLPFALRAGEGPMPERPVRRMADVERLDPAPDAARFKHIIDLLKSVREELKGELPVIVFAGAPFTLGSYCIGTGKDIGATRRFAAEHPDVWAALLNRLQDGTIHFLTNLIKEGADLYQLFDSWAGALDAEAYGHWAHVYHTAIFSALPAVAGILFVKECPYLDRMAESGADVVSLGRRHDLGAARAKYPDVVFQGNIDQKLLTSGTPDQITEVVRRSIQATGGQKHIVNLNHGLTRDTPVANFEAFVRAAKMPLDK